MNQLTKEEVINKYQDFIIALQKSEKLDNTDLKYFEDEIFELINILRKLEV